jgi:hypothetical protein
MDIRAGIEKWNEGDEGGKMGVVLFFFVEVVL